MKLLTSLIMALTVLFTVSAQADITSDKQSVDTACTQEAAAANCGNAQVGSGLLKCLHAYKQANKSYQLSAGCKAAMVAFEGDKKAKKAKKGELAAQPSTTTGTTGQ